MTFLGAPLSTLLVAGGAAAAALVALYLLKPARRRVEVPYARLWGLTMRDARATRIARRLRRWESLLLQLFIAALILAALADPHVGKEGARPRHVILIDTSASMQARDRAGGPTRLERARLAADKLLDGLRADEEAMIVAFDAAPRVRSPLTSDEALLRAAVADLRASDAPDAILPALQLAADALAGAEAPRLTLVTDGAFEPAALAALRAGIPGLAGVDLRHVLTGDPPPAVAASPMALAPGAENVAITGFSVRRYPANPSAYEILVEVRSFSERARHARLTITQEGEPVEVTELDLPPRGRSLRRLADLSGEGRRLEARLDVQGFDALALDDHAYAVLPVRKRTRVLLVGESNLYTEGALLLDRAIETVRQRPAAWDPAAAAAFDAIVFDGFTPPAAPPRPSLFLGCEAPGCPFSTKGAVSAPLVTEVEREHPLLKWVALKDLNVSRATVFAPARGDVALASSLGKPILIAGERGGLRHVALGFSPSQSDLPLRVAFPVLLVNALGWLGGVAADDAAAVRTGERARLVALGPTLALTSPRGEALALPVREGRAELVAEQAGFYARTGGGEGERVIAANLGDARESWVTARPVRIGATVLDAPPIAGSLRPRALLWRWLVAAALLLVLLEWWSFHRRWTV